MKDPIQKPRYRVGIEHGGKLKWKYCHRLEKALMLQSETNPPRIMQKRETDRYVTTNFLPQ